MRKLARIADVVVSVANSCQRYNLNEQDLPDGLRIIIGSLQRYVHSISVLFRSLMNDQRVGCGRRCPDEVCKGE